jgi:glycosyltransferase involved in cell wall biosynthesis
MRATRVALLTNIPAPYRVPVYDRLAAELGDNFRVLYLAPTEPNRQWQLPELKHEHRYLKGVTIKGGLASTLLRRQEVDRDDVIIHLKLGVIRELRAFKPDIVITAGFSLPMLAGWLYALGAHAPHIVFSDGWRISEEGLSWAHRLVRRIVASTSAGFVGASRKTIELYRSYGASDNLFLSPLCVDNEQFLARRAEASDRSYDLVFAGRLIAKKMPLFFTDVVARLAHERRTVSAIVIGDGPLRRSMEERLNGLGNVRVTFTGNLQQQDLPQAYSKGKVFCFPTLHDAWGMVANEACAAGLPVLTCARAGSADELVAHGENGYVLPLDVDIWAEHAQRLISDDALRTRMGASSVRRVADYNFEAAASGLLKAIDACLALTASHRFTPPLASSPHRASRTAPPLRKAE